MSDRSNKLRNQNVVILLCLSLGLRWMNLSQDGALSTLCLYPKLIFESSSLGFPQFAFSKIVDLKSVH
eukprot:UN24252